MTRTLCILALLALAACGTPATWPHNETPHVYQETDGVWTDLGAVE